MMNSINTNFDQIIAFAKNYNLPLGKKRAILRELLQVKILDRIYQEKISVGLFFVGGTGLRLLRGLDRFSEYLDFDISHHTSNELDVLINITARSIQKENIALDLYSNITDKRKYYEFRFKDLLYELKLSSNPEEKLMIKFDFETFWKHQLQETILLNRYGFLTSVVTIPLNQLLVQKLTAYLLRRETQPRDIYDIVWLISQGARIDKQFLQHNQLPNDLLSKVKEKFIREKTRIKTLQSRLKPFLINEQYVSKISLLSKLI